MQPNSKSPAAAANATNEIPNDVFALYERHTKIKTRPLLNEYLRLLRAIIEDFSRVYIIIDGIDECSRSKFNEKQFPHWNYDIRHQICKFITSRYLPRIERELHGARRLQIQANDEEITKYFVQRLEKWEFLKPRLEKDPSLRERIIGSIVSKA